MSFSSARSSQMGWAGSGFLGSFSFAVGSDGMSRRPLRLTVTACVQTNLKVLRSLAAVRGPTGCRFFFGTGWPRASIAPDMSDRWSQSQSEPSMSIAVFGPRVRRSSSSCRAPAGHLGDRL